MSDLLAARWLMAVSLGFHIVFAVVGMAMPLLMVIAEGRFLRTGDRLYRELAQRWSKGVAILFAVGAVSGTALSFELGLLWPTFMEHAGPVIGMPFSLEGFAFLIEAICLGLYLYGWDKLPGPVHLLFGIGVLVSGTASGVLVVAANAWMNQPAGFTIDAAGRFVDIDVWRAMANPMWIPQALHMAVAAFVAVGFAVAGIHAWMLLRRPGSQLHRRALVISLWVGGVAAVLMPVTGDVLAKRVADTQPIKLAAMEGQWQTEKSAPLRIGGWPDQERETTRYAIEIPALLSILAHGDPDATVRGLKEFPADERPPVAIVHLAFQIMVLIGGYLAALSVLIAIMAWRRRALPDSRWLLRTLAYSFPLGVLAIEAGWVVTEVGRQPWIIFEVMRVEDAVTPASGLGLVLVAVVALYLLLAVTSAVLLKRHVFQTEAAP